MNVSINESCIACGACESICKDVFSVDNVAEVNHDLILGHEECIKVAALSCPVSAIEIE